MAKIVFEFIVVIFHHVEALVLDLPSRSAGFGDFGLFGGGGPPPGGAGVDSGSGWVICGFTLRERLALRKDTLVAPEEVACWYGISVPCSITASTWSAVSTRGLEMVLPLPSASSAEISRFRKRLDAAPKIDPAWKLPADYGYKYGRSPFAPSLARTSVEGVENAPINPAISSCDNAIAISIPSGVSCP